MDDTFEERGVERREKAALVWCKEEVVLHRTMAGIQNKIRMKMNLLQYLDLEQEIKTALRMEIEELLREFKKAGVSNSVSMRINLLTCSTFIVAAWTQFQLCYVFSICRWS